MTENSKASNQDSKKAHGTRAPHKGASKRHSKPAPKQRTPEEEKIFQEAVAKAEAAKKARADLIGVWEKQVEGMSYRQIRGELKRVIRGKFLGESVGPLSIAEAICLDTMMVTTKMRDNLAGQLSHYLNPGIATSSPRYTL